MNKKEIKKHLSPSRRRAFYLFFAKAIDEQPPPLTIPAAGSHKRRPIAQSAILCKEVHSF
ncbi:hypothetical protein [Pseudomonas sp. CFBP 5750]